VEKSSEADAAERQLLQDMLDSDQPLSASQKTKIFQLGLKKTEQETTEAADPGALTQEDESVALVWSTLKPQFDYFNPAHEQQRQINVENLKAYLLAHPELRPVTLAILDRAFQVLLSMYAIQTNSCVHKRRGFLEGGRCYDYRPENDSTIKVAPRRYTPDEIATFYRKLVMSGIPQGSSITVGSPTYYRAIEILGEEPVRQLLGNFSGESAEVAPQPVRAERAQPKKLSFRERMELSNKLVAGGLPRGSRIEPDTFAYDRAVEIIGQENIDLLLAGA
jgi:hypothetical protein